MAVPDAPRLFILLLYQFQGAPYFFLRVLPTLSIDSLLIIYHTGQSVPCIIAGAPHDNGWMKLSCLYTKWQRHLEKPPSKFFLLSAHSRGTGVSAHSILIK